MAVAAISVDAYLFLALSDLTCHLEDTGIEVFWLQQLFLRKNHVLSWWSCLSLLN